MRHYVACRGVSLAQRYAKGAKEKPQELRYSRTSRARAPNPKPRTSSFAYLRVPLRDEIRRKHRSQVSQRDPTEQKAAKRFEQKATARRSRNHKGRVIGVSALDDQTDTQWVNEGLKWLKDRPGMGSFIL
jgi:hypothetical protein